MLNHIDKFVRALGNVGGKNPVTTATATTMVLMPPLYFLVHMTFQMPMLTFQVVGGVILTLALGITAKRIYEEYKNEN